jgi:antitoxin FitA
MLQLLIPDLDLETLDRLRTQAAQHGRTVETEAKAILAAALQPDPAKLCAEIDAFRGLLAASGRTFSDSTELIREDRDR